MKAARKLDMAKGHGATCASDLEPLKFDASRRDKKRLKSPRDKSDSTYRGWERRRTRGGERRRTPGFVTPGKSCVYGGRKDMRKGVKRIGGISRRGKKKKNAPNMIPPFLLLQHFSDTKLKWFATKNVGGVPKAKAVVIPITCKKKKKN